MGQCGHSLSPGRDAPLSRGEGVYAKGRNREEEAGGGSREGWQRGRVEGGRGTQRNTSQGDPCRDWRLQKGKRDPDRREELRPSYGCGARGTKITTIPTSCP